MAGGGGAVAEIYSGGNGQIYLVGEAEAALKAITELPRDFSSSVALRPGGSALMDVGRTGVLVPELLHPGRCNLD